jgi:hypothetical protein
LLRHFRTAREAKNGGSIRRDLPMRIHVHGIFFPGEWKKTIRAARKKSMKRRGRRALF